MYSTTSEPTPNREVPNSTNKPNLRGPFEYSQTTPYTHEFGDVQKRSFSGNLESYGDLGSPLLLKVDELLLFFSALNQVDHFLDPESRRLENIKQALHTGHCHLVRLFTLLDSTTGLGILKGDGLLPLSRIVIRLLLKGGLVLEAVELDLAFYLTLGQLLLNTQSRKRRGQIQHRVELVGMNHVNNTQSIGLQPIGRIICQDLGIRESLDDLIQHQHVAKGFRSKDGSLGDISSEKLCPRTTHTGAIDHGFGVVHANVRNIGFAKPARIRSRTTGHIQELGFILILAFQPDLSNRCPNVAGDVGSVE